MPIDIGGAAAAGAGAVQEYMMQQAQLEHQKLMDSLALQRGRQEQKRFEVEQSDRERDVTAKRIAEMQPGDMPDQELVSKAKQYGLRLPIYDAQTAIKNVEQNMATGAAALSGNAPLGASAVPVPTSPVGTYAGSPQQQAGIRLGRMVSQGAPIDALAGEAIKSGQMAPSELIRLEETRQGRKEAAEQRADLTREQAQLRYQQFQEAEAGRAERASQSSEDRRFAARLAADTRRELSEMRKSQEGAVDLSPAGKALAAKFYAKTGQLPPMGMGKEGAKVRTEIIDMAASYDPKKDVFVDAKTGVVTPGGMDLAANKAAYHSNSIALDTVTKNKEATELFASTADKNKDKFERIIGGVPDVGIAGFPTRVARDTFRTLGSTKMTQFDVFMRSLQNEYAKLTTQGNITGAPLSDASRKEIEAALRPDATVAQIRTALATFQTEGRNRLKSASERQDALRGAIKSGEFTGEEKTRHYYDAQGNPIEK